MGSNTKIWRWLYEHHYESFVRCGASFAGLSMPAPWRRSTSVIGSPNRKTVQSAATRKETGSSEPRRIGCGHRGGTDHRYRMLIQIADETVAYVRLAVRQHGPFPMISSGGPSPHTWAKSSPTTPQLQRCCWEPASTSAPRSRWQGEATRTSPTIPKVAPTRR